MSILVAKKWRENSKLKTVKANQRTVEQRRASTAKTANRVTETPYGNFMISVSNQLIVPLNRVKNKPKNLRSLTSSFVEIWTETWQNRVQNKIVYKFHPIRWNYSIEKKELFAHEIKKNKNTPAFISFLQSLNLRRCIQLSMKWNS